MSLFHSMTSLSLQEWSESELRALVAVEEQQPYPKPIGFGSAQQQIISLPTLAFAQRIELCFALEHVESASSVAAQESDSEVG
jgi:hypothetical protein